MIGRGSKIETKWIRLRFATTVVILGLLTVFITGSLSHFLRPACPIAMSGGSCPSCGLTRSISLAFHGDFKAAVVMNSSGLWYFTLVVSFALLRPIPYLFPSKAVILSDGLAFVVMWVLISICHFGLPGVTG